MKMNDSASLIAILRTFGVWSVGVSEEKGVVCWDFGLVLFEGVLVQPTISSISKVL